MHDGLFLICLLIFLTGWGIYMHCLDSAPAPTQDSDSLPQTTLA